MDATQGSTTLEADVLDDAAASSNHGGLPATDAPAANGAPKPEAVPVAGTVHACRFCGEPLTQTFVDLGMSPLCESFLAAEQVDAMEPFYPLQAFVCGGCLLVQLPEYVSAEHIFSEYAYFSSFSDSWLLHAKRYVDTMIERFQLGPQSSVVEIASNDGYLLQNFVAHGIRALGVEPAANIARWAVGKGVPTVCKFFGRQTAEELAADGVCPDLMTANNVLAHVPDLNDFVAGFRRLLAPTGVVTFEFPHLLRLMEGNQFDTLYHEHFCYFSFSAARNVLAAHGLVVFDVEEWPTHGGSLRVFARHIENESLPVGPRVDDLLQREDAAGLTGPAAYAAFAERVRQTKHRLLEFLIDAKRAGRSVAGYGAPGKGNTLLNYCGIRTDFLDYTVDRNPYKHGKFLPGTHIPIFAPEKIAETRPDYVLILPWNLRDEIINQLAYIREWGGQFVVPIPELEVC
ncbi:MAG: class I SAM-dependent methyltransferase [Planctomycetia bacterium]|nr:class I SAM-dependent methyltransferase [Planctomycetia bacterium]